MKTEEVTNIVKYVALMLGIVFDHYDYRILPLNYFENDGIVLEKRPLVVIYSEQYGHWTASILEDGTIITPVYRFIENKQKLLAKLTPEMREALGTLSQMDEYEKNLVTSKDVLVKSGNLEKITAILG